MQHPAPEHVCVQAGPPPPDEDETLVDPEDDAPALPEDDALVLPEDAPPAPVVPPLTPTRAEPPHAIHTSGPESARAEIRRRVRTMVSPPRAA